MNCETCQAKLPTLKTRLTRVNEALHQLGMEYHDTLSYSLSAIDRTLAANNFKEIESHPIFSGQGGALHQEVGEGKWLTVSWYRFESGRYEVTAYVN